MNIINIFNIDELIYQLDLIKDKHKYNYVCHNSGEFGWVILILHLIRKYIIESKKENYKVICFCKDGQEVFYEGMEIDILFVFKIDINNYTELKKNLLNYKVVKTSYGEIKWDDMKNISKYLHFHNNYLNNSNYKTIIENSNFNDIFYHIHDSNNILQNTSYFRSNLFKVSKKKAYKKDMTHVSDILIKDRDFLLKNLYKSNNRFIENKHVTFIIRNSYKWKQRDLCLKKMFKLISQYLKLNYHIIIIQDIIPVEIKAHKNIININFTYLNWKIMFDKICNSEIIFGAYSGLIEAIIYKLDCNIKMLLRNDIGKYKPKDQLIKKWTDFQNLKNKTFSIL